MRYLVAIFGFVRLSCFVLASQKNLLKRFKKVNVILISNLGHFVTPVNCVYCVHFWHKCIRKIFFCSRKIPKAEENIVRIQKTQENHYKNSTLVHQIFNNEIILCLIKDLHAHISKHTVVLIKIKNTKITFCYLKSKAIRKKQNNIQSDVFCCFLDFFSAKAVTVLQCKQAEAFFSHTQVSGSENRKTRVYHPNKIIYHYTLCFTVLLVTFKAENSKKFLKLVDSIIKKTRVGNQGTVELLSNK